MPDAQVSFEDENIILVDADDNVLGSEEKRRCHDGAGRLHRAFSVFLFDGQGRTLLQRRAAGKRLWPEYWSNGCCSHPRVGETIVNAANRRIREELSVRDVTLDSLFKFCYQESYRDLGSENELCHVLVARFDGDVDVNSREVEEWRWVHWQQLDHALTVDDSQYTPWMKLEWATMRKRHWSRVARLWA